MTMVLIRKFADWIDGIDLSRFSVGDVLELPCSATRLLAAEGWAIADRRRTRTQSVQRVARRRSTDRGNRCRMCPSPQD